MNRFQEAWWQQAQSDHAALVLLRRHGAAACRQLHYLQTATEKLGKAYCWRTADPPPGHHAGFVQFMRFLGGVRRAERSSVADAFGFARFGDFQRWVRTILPMCYALERLAPLLAQDGPNPEYPWPQHAPRNVPATFQFAVWNDLSASRGRQLLNVIQDAIRNSPQYA